MKTTFSPQLILIWNWIKEAITNVWRCLLGFILLFLAVGILLLVSVAALIEYLIFTPFEKKKAREILTENGSFNKLVSIGIDILGNIVGVRIFNKLFLKEVKQFPFGIAGQRISSVLQWNFLINNLTKDGLNLYNLLEFLEKEHGRKSVDAEIRQAEQMIQLNSDRRNYLKNRAPWKRTQFLF